LEVDCFGAAGGLFLAGSFAGLKSLAVSGGALAEALAGTLDLLEADCFADFAVLDFLPVGLLGAFPLVDFVAGGLARVLEGEPEAPTAFLPPFLLGGIVVRGSSSR
jgi:hypothetical protein